MCLQLAYYRNNKVRRLNEFDNMEYGNSLDIKYHQSQAHHLAFFLHWRKYATSRLLNSFL